MILDRADERQGARFLLVLAGAVVVIAGLKAAATIVVPFVLALFLSAVSMPVLFALRRTGVWTPAAVGLTVLLNVLVFALIIVIGTTTLGDLDEKLPRYVSAVQSLAMRWILELDAIGIPASSYLNVDVVSGDPVLAAVRRAAAAAARLFSIAFLVGVIMIFVLAEANVFPLKFLAILGETGHEGLRIAHIVQEVQAYLWLKSLISLATGVFVTLLCLLMDVDFPVLLGLIAFVLNFVPTIGSIIAAAPGILLALILHGGGTGLIVALGYLAINTIIGNILDPHIMGHRLGLSTLVVVLSLLFWGWVWGPVGALLSVPLTMVLKIVLQNVPDLRWIAVLLDKSPPSVTETADAKPASPGAAAPREASGAPAMS